MFHCMSVAPLKSGVVAEKFEAYPAQAKKRLLQIRALIFDVAKSEEIPEVTGRRVVRHRQHVCHSA